MKVILTILSFLLLQVTHATNYYFSYSIGSDAGDGTLASPYQNLAKLNSVTLAAGDSVLLKRGDTWLEQLPINQSGTSSNRITFAAYGTGANPLVTGLYPLTSWSNIGGNIWQAALNAGSYLNMVTSNGVQLQRGRWPNRTDVGTDSGWLTYEGVSGFTSITDNNYPGSITSWGNGSWITMRTNDFQINTYPIANQTYSSGASTFTYNGSSDTMQSTPRLGNGYFIQNDPRTLDQQGEWYYDPSAHLLKMYSTVNPGTLNIQAARIDNVIYCMNKNYITIDGIDFTGGNRVNILWSTGVADSLKNCKIAYAGGQGVEMKFHTSLGIKNCTFQYCNRRGAEMTLATNSSIIYSSFLDIGLIRGAAGRDANGNQSLQGAFINGQNTAVRYCTVRRTGYAGITATQDSVFIEYNLIDSACMVTDDAGLAYVSDASLTAIERLRFVRYNTLLHSVGSREGTGRNSYDLLGSGVYCDEATSNTVIEDNTIAFCSNHGVFIHDSRNITIRGNTIYDFNHFGISIAKDQAQPDYRMRGMVIRGNKFFSTRYATARDADAHGLLYFSTDSTSIDDLKLFGICDSNYYSNAFAVNEQAYIKTTIGANTGSSHDSAYTLSLWRQFFSQDAHSKASDIRYPGMTLVSARPNDLLSNNFNSSVTTTTINYTSGITTRSMDVQKMDGGSLRLDYTGSSPATDRVETWFRDAVNNNAGNWSKDTTYLLEWDVQTSSDREAEFAVQIRSAAASASTPSEFQYFKAASDRRHIVLKFTLANLMENHFVSVSWPAAVGTVWFDNVRFRPATITRPVASSYMSLNYAHASPLVVQTDKAYTDEKRVRKGQVFTVPVYSAAPVFIIPGLVERVKGFIRPRTQ